MYPSVMHNLGGGVENIVRNHNYIWKKWTEIDKEAVCELSMAAQCDHWAFSFLNQISWLSYRYSRTCSAPHAVSTWRAVIWLWEVFKCHFKTDIWNKWINRGGPFLDFPDLLIYLLWILFFSRVQWRTF